jgi:hypothetical protein
MDCRSFQKDLEDYLEGGLDFAGRFGMERHAQQCYLCGRDIANARELAEMARGLKPVAAPPHFESAVLARIHAKDSRSWFRSFWIYGPEWPSLRSLALGVCGLALVGLTSLATLSVFNKTLPPEAVSRSGPEQVVAPTVPQQTTRPVIAPPLAETRAPHARGPLAVETKDAANARARERSRFSTDEAYDEGLQETADLDYVEFPVPGPDNSQFIMRLPKTIRMRYAQPSQEHFIRNVSH